MYVFFVMEESDTLKAAPVSVLRGRKDVETCLVYFMYCTAKNAAH